MTVGVPAYVYTKLFLSSKVALTTAPDFQEVIWVPGLYIPVGILTGSNLTSYLPF